jgi:hypothetical protein
LFIPSIIKWRLHLEEFDFTGDTTGDESTQCHPRNLSLIRLDLA